MVTRLTEWFNWRMFLVLVLVFVLTAGAFQYLRPLPKLKPTLSSIPAPSAVTANLPFQSYGQAAVAEDDFGLLASSGNQTPAPMASTAKVVTALALLKQKPLTLTDSGPMLTMTDSDVAIYNSYKSQDGSVIKVAAGEQINEYQALEAMLIPSANNMADSLAIWAFGSLDDYTTYANQMLQNMGATQTKVVGASGFMSGSVSTAENLVKLGQALMQDPVLAQIVSQKTAVLPVAGEVSNYNGLLNSDGVIGIKTGNTDEAGGCFVWAAKHTVDGQTLNLVGAEMGAPNLQQALKNSRAVIQAIDQNFINVTLVKKGQVLGSVSTPWGQSIDIVAKDDFTFLTWKGWSPIVNKDVKALPAPVASGSEVGSMSVTLGKHIVSEPLVINSDIASPPWTWRVFR